MLALATLNPIAVSGLVIALSTAVIAGLMFTLGARREQFIWGIFCLSVCVWGGSFFFIARTADPQEALLWWRIAHVGIIFIPITFFHFVLEFTGKRENRAMAALYAIGAVLAYSDVGTNLIVAHVRPVFGEFYYDSPPGPLYTYLTLLFVALIVYAHLAVYRAYRKSTDPLQRSQFRYFLTATSIGFLAGGVSFLPVYGIDVYPISILAVAVAPVLIGFAILRFQLFNLRTVTAQMLTLVIVVSAALHLVFSQTALESVLNGFLFAASLIVGVFLIRGVKTEVGAREIIEKQKKELEASNQRLENFVHFLSHEVKGYLTHSEAAFAAIAEGDYGAVSPDLKALSQRALAETRTGVDTVMDILNAGNFKQGTVNYAMCSFDLREVVATIVEEMRPLAQQKKLDLTLSVARGANFMVIGDAAQLGKHVIYNLIDNAVKYTPAGSVAVSLARSGKRILLSVTDTGVGITEEDKARLFTEGGRGKDSLKVNAHSTGYGLFIARSIVEAHHGRIWAESPGTGKGTTFFVELTAQSD